MEKITAEEAERLATTNRKESNELIVLYSKIKEESNSGQFSVMVSYSECSPGSIRILKEDGFEVVMISFLAQILIKW